MKKIIVLIAILSYFAGISFAQDVKDEMYYKRQIQNQRFLYGKTGLFNAIKKENALVVEAFMKTGFDANTSYSATPALIYSINRNSPEIAKILLDYGADPETVTLGGQNALTYAISKKNSSVVQELINHKVDVNKDCKGINPLNYAIEKKQAKIVEILLEAGAKPNEKTKKLVEKSQDEYLKSLF